MLILSEDKLNYYDQPNYHIGQQHPARRYRLNRRGKNITPLTATYKDN